MNIQNIVKQILFKFNKTGWKDDQFEMEIYPYDNKSTISFRHVVMNFKKQWNMYSCKLKLEILNYCILTVEESERDVKRGDEDYIIFDFNIKPEKTFNKCIESTIKQIYDVCFCESCLRVYDKSELDSEDVCLNCNIQHIFETKKDTCCICMDAECVKLNHRLPCEHEFHFTCLTKLKKKECPLCRACFSLRRK